MRILLIGYFANDEIDTGGQPVKTKLLLDYLNQWDLEIYRVDTFFVRNRPTYFWRELFRGMLVSEHILVLPARNGVKYLLPLVLALSKIFGRTIHYVVIGGWIMELLRKRSLLRYIVFRCDKIYVETNIIKDQLVDFGFSRVIVMPNAKPLKPLRKTYAINNLKFVYFSRVIKEKGILDAISVIVKLNLEHKSNATLDIYGPIPDDFNKLFHKIVNNHSEIRYKGIVDPLESIAVLKNYFMMLFPTRYYTEGVPGTIIDSLAAGLPVITSDWESKSDVLKERETCLTYDFKDNEDFYRVLHFAVQNQALINRMRSKCVKESSKFLPENAFALLLNELS